MDYTSFLYDDFALEAADANEESIWTKIKNAFQRLLDACSEKIQRFKQTKFAKLFSKAFAKIKSFFNQAQADRENAHEYLRKAREEYEEALDELKEARKSKDKDLIAYAKDNVNTKRKAYREANKMSKRQWKEQQQAHNEKQKMYNKMAKDRWGSGNIVSRADAYKENDRLDRAASVTESYSDADFALEAALNEYDQMMSVANDPSLCMALDNMKNNIEINCTTAEECANVMDSLNDQIDAFNRHISTLRVATENYMEDQDREAFQVTTRNAMTALESSYDALGLVSESGRFDEACIEQLHNFFDGASQIMADKAEEFEYEDDAFGASESFLGALVQ